MHRLRDQSSVTRLRLAAWLLLTASFTGSAIAGLLLYSTVIAAPHPAYVALILVGVLGVLMLLQLFYASQTRCPICLVTPLAPHRCTKNRRAGKLLGSYRLRVAASVVNTGVFKCPYCGEVTKVEPRGTLPAAAQGAGRSASSRLTSTLPVTTPDDRQATRYRGFSKCQPRQTDGEAET